MSGKTNARHTGGRRRPGVRGLRFRLVLWAVPGILLVGIGALFFARAANRSVESRELEVRQGLITMARGQLESMRSQLLTGLMEYAFWDGMLDLGERPESFTGPEAARWLEEVYEADFSVFVDSSGEVVYAADPTGHHRLGDQVGNSPLAKLAYHRPGEVTLWQKSGNPVYLVASMIHGDGGVGEDGGWIFQPEAEGEGFVIVGQTLSSEFFSSLSTNLGGRVRLEYVGEPASGAEEIEALTGPDGRPAAKLVLTPDTGVAVLRWTGFRAIVVYFLVAQVLGLILLVLASDRIIIRPLHALQQGVAELRHRGALSASLLPSGQDEVGELAREIADLALALDTAEKLHGQASAALLESEDQLRHSQKMEAIGLLTGGIAHSFNNLLTVINGYTGLVLKKLGPTHPQGRELEQVYEAGERAAKLTDQLLAFSRQQVFEPVVLDLNDVVAKVDKLLSQTLGEDIEIVLSLDPELDLVKVDRGQMEQVLLNLAVNARDAMPGGGCLTLVTENFELGTNGALDRGFHIVPGSYVSLRVSDTGSGIDEATRERIFDPFFTTKEQGKGTGLGLATVFGTVKQSRGYIWVDSEPGHGTTFQICLPRSEEAIEVVHEVPQAFDFVGGFNETILVVEDERMVREYAVGVLRETGYRLLEARHPKEALEICEGHTDPIDLLVTDIVMPGATGQELAAQIQSSRPETRVLYVSGYSESQSTGRLDPSLAFLAKPFSAVDLAQKVREILDEAPSGSHPIGGVDRLFSRRAPARPPGSRASSWRGRRG